MKTLVYRICAGGAALAILAGAAASSAQPSQPDLHAALHIRPDQEAAFHAYQAAIAPPQREQGQLRADIMRMRSVSTPERLSLMGQMQAIQSSLFDRYASATRAFYATLSGDQQRIFDQVTLPPPNSGPSSAPR